MLRGSNTAMLSSLRNVRAQRSFILSSARTANFGIGSSRTYSHLSCKVSSLYSSSTRLATPSCDSGISRRLLQPFQSSHFSSSPRFRSINSPSNSLPKTPFFQILSKLAVESGKREELSPVVVHASSGEAFSYQQLLGDVVAVKNTLLESNSNHPDWNKSLSGQRIAFLVESGYSYVVSLLAIMACDAISVPLSPAFPATELDYILFQSEARFLLSSPTNKAKAQTCNQMSTRSGRCRLVLLPPLGAHGESGECNTNSDIELRDDYKKPVNGGMMLYTSGTTAKPKGVLLPQAALISQVKDLRHAWAYSQKDHLLHVLPLHHIHGIVNGLLTPLLSGSTIEFMSPFNATAVWKRLAAPFIPTEDGVVQVNPVTIFTAVPTIYSRLLAEFPKLPADIQDAAQEAIQSRNLRLCMSGSAALPSPIMDSWTKLSNGNSLLERYGMTEVGMALSCGLSHKDRVSGSVGWPLPSVEVRLVDSESGEVISPGEELDCNGKERLGEIHVRGPSIFREYWRNPRATESEFTETETAKGKPEWFKTGDIAVRRQVWGTGQNEAQQDWATGRMYFIQGRKSADIIKTGGEKVSALEVEREILALSEIAECAVVGVSSETWGQKVAAIVVLTDKGKTAGRRGKGLSALDLRRALHDRLTTYKIPQEMKVVDEIPRNAMGKINKKMLVKEMFPESS